MTHTTSQLPSYTYRQTYSFPMTTTTTMSGPLQPQAANPTDQQAVPTLPLLQPMDLSQYNIYETPLVSHSTLPVSNDRSHHTPSTHPYSSTPYSGSPRVLPGYNFQQAGSAFSSPQTTHLNWNTHTRSYSDSSMMFTPSPYAALPNLPVLAAGSKLRGLTMPSGDTPGKGVEDWNRVEYQYAQPFVGWEMAAVEDHEAEGQGDVEREKAIQKTRRHVW